MGLSLSLQDRETSTRKRYRQINGIAIAGLQTTPALCEYEPAALPDTPNIQTTSGRQKSPPLNAPMQARGNTKHGTSQSHGRYRIETKKKSTKRMHPRPNIISLFFYRSGQPAARGGSSRSVLPRAVQSELAVQFFTIFGSTPRLAAEASPPKAGGSTSTTEHADGIHRSPGPQETTVRRGNVFFRVNDIEIGQTWRSGSAVSRFSVPSPATRSRRLLRAAGVLSSSVGDVFPPPRPAQERVLAGVCSCGFFLSLFGAV